MRANVLDPYEFLEYSFLSILRNDLIEGQKTQMFMDEKQPKEPAYSFKNLLEKLQEESWQLELLVSGFAIVLVVGAYEPLQDLRLHTEYLSMSITRSFFVELPVNILFVGWFFLLVNLILHVLCRGLWISTIGLRYVSGDVDFDALKFSDRFRRFLQRRIVAFDTYIERLERLCSVIFAFTFLIIFAFISFGLYVIVLGGVINLVRGFDSDLIGTKVMAYTTMILSVLLLLAGLLYFIDFITLGFFKRKKWTARWYMPIYRLMSLITLSFLYRPIYYNFIDNKFGRRIGYLMVPYIIMLGLLSSLYFQTHPFYPEIQARHLRFHTGYYDDLREENTIVETPAMPSPYISNGFLELFIPYLPKEDDRRLKLVCPEFEPHKKTRLKSEMVRISTVSMVDLKENADSSFLCLTEIYRLQVNDTLFRQVDYFLHTHPNREEKGLRTTLDVDFLARGKHDLIIQKHTGTASDSLQWKTYYTIPFWKE